ncbi:MAG: rhodanese-like domain-containing protein [Candidatus Dormibacteraeota bacterium]|nr:rhodanese-like domain-containing protein [Candidatus Dormibacteraeota bacterium]
MASAPAPLIDIFPAPELGNSSFLVSDPDAGVSVAIDPLRDVAGYLERAEALGGRIALSLETHVHNDFVSGAREIEAAAGAPLGAAGGAGLEYPHRGLSDGDEIPVGRWRLCARHTPGHTPTHLSYVLKDQAGRSLAIFSGGALMVGAIARTDLFGPHLATALTLEAYRTLHQRLRDLPDDVAVYPTHGSGSFCAAAAATDSAATSTMGAERLGNPFFNTTELLPFLARALDRGPYPLYYRDMAALNRRGAPLLGLRPPPLAALSPAETEVRTAAGAALVDIRPAIEYDRAHVPGSYCIGLGEEPFSAWVGWVVARERSIVLTGGTLAMHMEAQRQLLRIGFDNAAAYLDGGIDAWAASGRRLSSFETAEVESLTEWILRAKTVAVVDVREDDEWAAGHVPGAVHIRVPDVARRASELPTEAPVAVHCEAGYRAGIAASLLEQAGLRRIVHVTGSFSERDRAHSARRES